jgi:hypothetical protein
MMDQFKLAIVMMAIIDSHWGPGDAHGRRREFTAEELDALADFGWHLPDIRGFVTACLNAVRGGWRLVSSNRAERPDLASAESS